LNIIEKLENYILNEIIVDLGVDMDSIGPEEYLLSKGIIDSIGILKLTDFLEKEFGIAVDDEDFEPENFKNLRSLERFVESKGQK
jgi:acyl carrier protein